MADVTGCRIKVPKVKEATAFGAAMAAGTGTGIYESAVKAADALAVWDKEYLPDSENYSKYVEIKEQWQEVYENQLNLVDRRLTQSMWTAPGVCANIVLDII